MSCKIGRANLAYQLAQQVFGQSGLKEDGMFVIKTSQL